MSSITKDYVRTFVAAIPARSAIAPGMYCPVSPPGYSYVLVDGVAVLAPLPGLPTIPPGGIPIGLGYTCYNILPYTVYSSTGVRLYGGTATGYAGLPTPPPGGYVSTELGLVTVCTSTGG